MTTDSGWEPGNTTFADGAAPSGMTVTPVDPAPGRRRWFREFGSILAVTALVFSFGTTFVSYVRTANQDEHDQRLELNGLAQRLYAIQRESVAAAVTYANNPDAIAALGRALTQEQLLVARQAARLMNSLPKDQVGASELAFVAAVLISNNIDGLGLSLLDRAVTASTDVNDRTGALRTLASRLFALGRLDDGRQKFGEALLVFDRNGGFPSDDALYVASTQFDTQLFWAQAELTYGSCDRAKEHAAQARTYVVKMAAADPRIPQLTSLEAAAARCTPAPSPSPGLVP